MYWHILPNAWLEVLSVINITNLTQNNANSELLVFSSIFLFHLLVQALHGIPTEFLKAVCWRTNQFCLLEKGWLLKKYSISPYQQSRAKNWITIIAVRPVGNFAVIRKNSITDLLWWTPLQTRTGKDAVG